MLSFPLITSLDTAVACRIPVVLIKNVLSEALTFRKLELGAGAFLAVFFPLFFTRITGKQTGLFKLQSYFWIMIQGVPWKCHGIMHLPERIFRHLAG